MEELQVPDDLAADWLKLEITKIYRIRDRATKRFIWNSRNHTVFISHNAARMSLRAYAKRLGVATGAFEVVSFKLEEELIDSTTN